MDGPAWGWEITPGGAPGVGGGTAGSGGWAPGGAAGAAGAAGTFSGGSAGRVTQDCTGQWRETTSVIISVPIDFLRAPGQAVTDALPGTFLACRNNDCVTTTAEQRDPYILRGSSSTVATTFEVSASELSLWMSWPGPDQRGTFRALYRPAPDQAAITLFSRTATNFYSDLNEGCTIGHTSTTHLAYAVDLSPGASLGEGGAGGAEP